MSIYTGGRLLRNLKEAAAKKIAKKDTTQRKKEGTWASIMALAKPALHFVAKAGVGALGVTNPYLLPLLYGGGTAALSKILDVAGRKFGAGADPSKIKANGKYGYGREEAKTLSEGLAESIKERDPLSKGNLRGDIVGSYLSALIPKIGIDPKTGKMGVQGGELAERAKKDIGKGLRAVKNKFLPSMEKATGLATAELSPFAAQMAKDPSKALSSFYQDTMGDVSLSEGLSETDYLSQISKAETPSAMEFAPSRPDVPLALEESVDMPWEMGRDIEQFSEFGKYGAMEESLQQQEMFSDWQSPSARPPEPPSSIDSLMDLYNTSQKYPQLTRGGFQQGGQVPSKSPTIADYFNQQGKTMGGSDTQSLQSLSQKLGIR